VGGREGAVVCVCGLLGLARCAAALRPSGLVSLVTAFEQPPTPGGLEPGRHFRLDIDDITEPLDGFVAPERHHVAALVDFLGGWDREAPLLIHCAAGISRSTAAALTALCLHSNEDEAELARRLRRAAPHAAPNRRIVSLADELMGRRGRLVAALEAMGPAEPAIEGPLVRLPLAPARGGIAGVRFR
jgi:predicted protein tyrosine phosphatase